MRDCAMCFPFENSFHVGCERATERNDKRIGENFYARGATPGKTISKEFTGDNKTKKKTHDDGDDEIPWHCGFRSGSLFVVYIFQMNMCSLWKALLLLMFELKCYKKRLFNWEKTKTNQLRQRIKK